MAKRGIHLLVSGRIDPPQTRAKPLLEASSLALSHHANAATDPPAASSLRLLWARVAAVAVEQDRRRGGASACRAGKAWAAWRQSGESGWPSRRRTRRTGGTPTGCGSGCRRAGGRREAGRKGVGGMENRDSAGQKSRMQSKSYRALSKPHPGSLAGATQSLFGWPIIGRRGISVKEAHSAACRLDARAAEELSPCTAIAFCLVHGSGQVGLLKARTYGGPPRNAPSVCLLQ